MNNVERRRNIQPLTALKIHSNTQDFLSRQGHDTFLKPQDL